MPTVSETLSIAVGHHLAGRLVEAEQLYRQILQFHPEHAHGWYLLGGLAYQVGNRKAAAQCIDNATKLAPEQADYHYDLGVILQELGKLDQAAGSYSRVLELRPEMAEAHANLGLVCLDRGELDEAIKHYRRTIELKPELAEVHNSLGVALQKQGRLDEAAACHRRALELNPMFSDAHFKLGNALQSQGRLDEGVACFRQAIRLKPDYPEVHNNLGIALFDQRKVDDAVVCYRRAIVLKPDFAEAHSNLGNALRDQGQLWESAACHRRALELKPDFAEVHNSLGSALRDLGSLDAAEVCFRRAIELRPNYAMAHANLGTVLKDLARLDEAVVCFRRSIELQPDFTRAHSNLVFTLQFCPSYDAAAIYAESRRWNERHAAPLAKSIEPHANDPTSARRLRIGYVSPDFREHCQSFFTVALLAAHDHSQFEIFCYADVNRPDDRTARLRSHADVWQNIAGLSDEQASQLVRRDQIDILVDLTMHMERSRLLVFARKPAPLQVCCIAYPGTTGLSVMDYRLTDPRLDPPGLHDQCYSEESIRLPDTFWCYDPLTSEPDVNRLPALNSGHITFGCLNNFCKVNDVGLKLWADVLRAIDRSRLILLTPEGTSRIRILARFEEQGIAAERIELVAFRPRPQYLELYHQIDIGLDTLPYNGHTTSLDALWMGVPVVTMVGQTVVGRAGVSQLTNLGLPELIAETPDQYVRIAAELAGDPTRLSQLRASLRVRMQHSPLMDGPRFARNVESAYRQMWQRWCAGKSAATAAALE
jgi:protein O-GlcNAc transferase